MRVAGPKARTENEPAIDWVPDCSLMTTLLLWGVIDFGERHASGVATFRTLAV
jgi:hypothetical protein